MKNVAVMVQNVIQWYTIKPLVQLLNKKQIPTDVLVFDPPQHSNEYHNIAKSLKNTVEKDGYKVSAISKKSTYYITIAPYSNMITFPSKYRLGYCYGAATTKPALTLQPEFKKGFHGMFLHDIYGAEIFSIYARTYIVPYLYLQSIRHEKTTPNKPTILFLPTYHEKSTIQTAQSLATLKNHYHIIAKKHHGTDYLNEENETRKALEKAADKLYDSTQSIIPLFKKADLVLSDNSGASMDAFYAKIPTAIAAPNINDGLAGIDTLQYQLASKGIFPYTNNPTPENLQKIIKLTLSKKQRELQSIKSDEFFPRKKGGAEKWLEIIEQYLNDDLDYNYCKLHDYIENLITTMQNENINLKNEKFILNNNLENLTHDYSLLQSEIATLKNELSIYKSSRAHQIIEKLLKYKR